MSTIFEERLRSRTRTSRALYDQAKRVLPGGVAANAKASSPYPLYFRQARGARIVDVDGNEYIDLVMGLGIHILGHAPDAVVAAVLEHLASGTMPGLATELEVQLARKVQQHIPCAEMVRFVNTGSEATLMAIRVARAYRKRDKIAKFEGGYDGQHDLVQVSTTAWAGSPDEPQPAPDCKGISQNTLRDLLILPYNDPERASALIAAHADELAGVIMEPIAGFSMGCVPATPDFVRAIREVTSKHDIPLILDEVVTNFRLGLGGACAYYAVTPDLVCLGKILGGGYPIGGFAGRRDLMDGFVTLTGQPSDRQEKIIQSGTFSGNAISMAAGLATIGILEQGEVYPHLDVMSERLRSGLKGIADRLGVRLAITGLKSMFQLHFGVDNISNLRDKARADASRAVELSHGLLANGVFATPRPLFMSAAHTQADVDEVLEVAERVLREMQRAQAVGVTSRAV